MKSPAIITLELQVAFGEEVVLLARPAPDLPYGVCWHKGMRYHEEVEGDGSYEVDFVTVLPSGECSVRFGLITLPQGSKDFFLNRWRKIGWAPKGQEQRRPENKPGGRQADRFLILAEVSQVTTLPPNEIEKLCRKNEFPQPIRLSSRCYRWRESEVLDFMANAPRGLK